MAAPRVNAHALALTDSKETEVVVLDFPHSGPFGTAWAFVGRHGSMEPGLCQCMAVQ